MSLWFVTPAFRRYELSSICFEQRRRVMDELQARGVDANCVVVADDDNLSLARAHGFSIVERDNRWLGRRFNDGFEHALSHGAEWIVPIGSDDWIDPDYLFPLPDGLARTARLYAPVESDRLALVTVADAAGAGPRMLHRSLFRTQRPSEERIRRGVDRSVLAALGPIDWEYRDLHPLQYVGFRGDRHITLYTKLVREGAGEERSDPWSLLAARYPADLVDRARAAMATVARPRSIGRGRLHWWGLRDRLWLWWGRVGPRGR